MQNDGMLFSLRSQPALSVSSASQPDLRPTRLAQWLALLWLACLAPSCQLLLGDREARILDTQTGETIAFEAFIERLSEYDFVFLGEQHGHRGTHDLQNRTTQALHPKRPNLVLSMEQWERDVQPVLDSYLAGQIDEPEFLEGSRPWNNYEKDYRPGVEWARAQGRPVIAANAPRPLAKQAMKEGLDSLRGHPHVAASVDVSEGAYWEEFKRLLGDMASHGGGDESMLKGMYVAQCVKDSTMAESMFNAGFPAVTKDASLGTPLVVHWCGRAHSDYRLGTVERLQGYLDEAASQRRIAVVSLVTADETMPDNPQAMADFLWVFPR